MLRMVDLVVIDVALQILIESIVRYRSVYRVVHPTLLFDPLPVRPEAIAFGLAASKANGKHVTTALDVLSVFVFRIPPTSLADCQGLPHALRVQPSRELFIEHLGHVLAPIRV